MSSSDFVDMHSHLLPGIDDGCYALEESLECVRILLDNGFVGTVCTPHMGWDMFPGNTPRESARRVEVLQDQLKAADLNYQLSAGGELRLDEDSVRWLEREGVPTLGSSRYVLVDFWGGEWPPYADRALEFLLAEGYQPILAHPERMDFDDRHWDDVLERVARKKIPLQGNLRCLAGREGPLVAARALRLLTEDRYHLLALDMHGSGDLMDRLAGLPVVEEQVGAAKLGQLLSSNPQKILAGA